jgi:hypothetical protein
MEKFKKLALIFSFIACSFLMLDTFSKASNNNEFSRMALKGINKFHVSLSGNSSISPDSEANYLSATDHIQSDVETKLSMAGINVANDEMVPYLSIEYRIIEQNKKGCIVYYVRLSVREWVTLDRDVTINGQYSETWSVDYLGVDPHFNSIKTKVDELVDVFLTAYFAVNPKCEKKPKTI